MSVAIRPLQPYQFREAFDTLNIELMQDDETKLAEGEGHKGRSAVISLIGM
jgi:hypothetical protein